MCFNPCVAPSSARKSSEPCDSPLTFRSSNLAACHLSFHSLASFSALSLASLSRSTSPCSSSALSLTCRISSTRLDTSPRSSDASSSASCSRARNCGSAAAPVERVDEEEGEGPGARRESCSRWSARSCACCSSKRCRVARTACEP